MLALLLAGLLAAPQTQAGWQLVWSDEFEGPANSAPDAAKWAYDLGASGWGNRELQNYTKAPENVSLDGHGNLVIRAAGSLAGGFTSGRLKTKDKFSFTYGKVEARIRIPAGQGIWPAFWMLGEEIKSVGWPACGEIDIMENVGREPSMVHGTVHGPGYSGGKGITSAYTLDGGQKFSDAFHTFSVIWTPESIEFFVDSTSYHKVTPASLPDGATWVFNKPFFLLLNVAVGGNWPGSPDASTVFPQTMLVDYVRVYVANSSGDRRTAK